MSRFNKRPSGLIVPSPIVSTPSPRARTGNNAPGFVRDAKSELFLHAVSNFVGQNKFYASAKDEDARFVNLVRQVAVEDPDWMGRFLPWLRNEANMRTASLTGALEAAKAMVDAKIPGGRKLVSSVLMRADEPGEALAYWLNTYGRKIPKPIKRGVADAATRLYGEYNTLKYDTASSGIRFGDVLELTHAKPERKGELPAAWKIALFKHLIDRRHGRDGIPSSLTVLHKNAWLREQVARGRTALLLESQTLAIAGMTWEDVLSLAGSKVPKSQLWEALIPSMGYMALLRNLRNFDEAGISMTSVASVIAKLEEPEQVARSRQLPMRFLSAYRAVNNTRWHAPLDTALDLSLQNVPQLKGRTLILIDTSGSMDRPFTSHGGKPQEGAEALKLWDAATVFGLAVALRSELADVVSFSSSSKGFTVPKGASLLPLVESFKRTHFMGQGTATEDAVRQHYRNHDQVLILTDEQANYHGYGDVAASVPEHKMVITFNLAGYRVGHAASGTGSRVTIGGLSDQAFKLLPILEKRQKGEWPF